jgi:hypothetical protein
MPERWIRIRGGGRIRIDPGWGTSSQPELRPSPVLGPSRPSESDEREEGGLQIGYSILERMEIRVESVFRPRTPDVEVLYVITGATPARPDQLHSLPSDAVIVDATTSSAAPNISKMIELLQKERSGPVELIVEFHTHPSGIALPSDADIAHWQYTASQLTTAFPNALVLFGIHAVSEQAPEFMERVDPNNVASNRIAWRSHTRDHELAIFTSAAEPYEVRIHE